MLNYKKASIHPLSIPLSLWRAWWSWSSSGWHWTSGRVNSGQVASPSQGWHRDKWPNHLPNLSHQLTWPACLWTDGGSPGKIHEEDMQLHTDMTWQNQGSNQNLFFPVRRHTATPCWLWISFRMEIHHEMNGQSKNNHCHWFDSHSPSVLEQQIIYL